MTPPRTATSSPTTDTTTSGGGATTNGGGVTEEAARRERERARAPARFEAQEEVAKRERERGDGRLPAGRHGLSREEVISSQRQRLLDATAELCAEKSYSAVRVAEIVERAGVSRATFYELFNDKEDCFVATLTEVLSRVMDAVMPAIYGQQADWPDQVEDIIVALLSYLASDPAYGKTAMVEAVAGGDRAFELYATGYQMLVTVLDQGRAAAPPNARIPSRTARVVVGACAEMIAAEMLSGRTERLPDLLPDFLYLGLTPYLGQAEAVERMSAARERVRDLAPGPGPR